MNLEKWPDKVIIPFSICVQVIYNRFKRDEKVIDITVEDPSDEFRRIRNVIDVTHCKDLDSFSTDKIKTGLTTEMVKEANKNFKVRPHALHLSHIIWFEFYSLMFIGRLIASNAE